MKQLHVREPWAGSAVRDRDLIQDLLNRLQVLEAKVKELEERQETRKVDVHVVPRETVPVRSREAIPAGV